jgi:poly-beta-1,6-N-acetyl-D-glucosamine synthase
MVILATAAFCLYFIFTITLYQGWRRVTTPKNRSSVSERMISVVVPARNESKNILSLLKGLLNQTYHKYEVIVVDDHSEDSTKALVSSFYSTKVTLIESNGRGKKTAIQTGIALARGEIIVTTDADCRVHHDWLENINACFSQDVSMVTGAVIFDKPDNFFERMQQLEFAALMGTGAATISLGYPTMCNGANLAYRRATFEEVNGFDGNMHIASGDDEFLMRKISKKKLGTIYFNNRDAVGTDAQPAIRPFIQQRLRWASKWKHNSSLLARSIALFILSFQALIIYSYTEILAGNYFYLTFVILKMFFEFGLLYRFTIDLKIKWRWPVFFAWQIMYPLYVISIGIISLFSGYRWKGRRYA